MSSFRSRIAERFASGSGRGNCALAPFFLDCAVMNARAALSNLDRAERDDPGSIESALRTRLEYVIEEAERAAATSWRRLQVREQATEIAEELFKVA